MNILDEIKKEVAGAALLKDWLGDGLRHVSQEQADHRSIACVRGADGNGCPHNRSAKWWEVHKQAAAGIIKSQMELKARMKISTPLEEHLCMCDVCGCALPLKVHVPTDHIRNHTTPEMLANYPPYCWQRIELESL